MTVEITPRAEKRVRIRCWLTLYLHGGRLWARTLDMTGSGVSVVSLVPIAVGADVRMRSRVSLLAGSARVKHCNRRGWLYRIGLEFERPVSSRF
jgi:hypothetical protein